jgi:hypothetical protein
MSTYRPVCGTEPCSKCPFRRRSPAGWLGEATPASFIVEISMERPLPCHPTIDYDDPEWLEKWGRQEIGKICAGSLILAANICKRPRDPRFPRLPRDSEAVFSTHLEFIRHHEDADVRSWETSSSFELRANKAMKKIKYRPVVCSWCERTRAVNDDGKVRVHRYPASGKRCHGSGTDQAGHGLAPLPYVRQVL